MSSREYRYPRAALVADYLRAGVGLALSGAPLLLLDLPGWAVAVFAGAAVLFAVFGARTLLRQLTTFRVDGHGVRAEGPFGAALAWRDLARVRLRYYSTRRDRSQGWMQLVLSGGGRTLRLESSLEGFEVIAGRAAAAAAANRLRLSDSTIANFLSLGIDVAPPAPDGRSARGGAAP